MGGMGWRCLEPVSSLPAAQFVLLSQRSSLPTDVLRSRPARPLRSTAPVAGRSYARSIQNGGRDLHAHGGANRCRRLFEHDRRPGRRLPDA